MAYLGPVSRWQVFRADLEPHVGREQAGEGRPVLVISNDEFNARFDIVTVLPLTRLEGKVRSPYPFEVELPKGTLPGGKTSLVMPYQIRTISKLRLLESMGAITDPGSRRDIEDRLLEHLGVDVVW